MACTARLGTFLLLPFLLGGMLLGGSLGCGPTSGGARAEEPRRGEESVDGARDAESAAVARVDRCADGSCFACGEALCPLGFYCDEDAPGGPACSWLQACPRDPDCACVRKELGSDCRCQERGAGLSVTCQ